METQKLDSFIAAAVDWWVAQLAPTEKNIDAFRKSCTSYILDKFMKPEATLTLSTDYTPDSALASICVDANIDPIRVAFTQKAVMIMNFTTLSIDCSIGNEEQKALYRDAA